MHIWSRICNRERTISSINGFGKTGHPYGKEWKWTHISYHTEKSTVLHPPDGILNRQKDDLKSKKNRKVPCVLLLLFSHSVVSDFLWCHGQQHARLPCPSLSSRVCSDSCPSGQWWPSNHLILCRPLLLLPPIAPSIRVFSDESALLIRWPKY